MLLMNTTGRCAWWNIGLWPVCPVPKTFGILRCLPISGLQTRWAHRLEVYVPLTRAYRRKRLMFIPAPKITPNVLGNLNMTENKHILPLQRFNVQLFNDSLKYSMVSLIPSSN